MYSFDEILGNEKIIKTLKNSVINGTLSHSYILDGNEKMGKKSIAFAFSKLLLCERKGESPCEECSSCKSFNTKNNPDFFFIKPEKNKINVSQIRDNVIKNIETKPFKYKYKVFVIDKAHDMTVQAQNAILKSIEEPPDFAIFILLSQNYNSFLPTILSRCILFKIKPITTQKIEEFLKKCDVDSEKANAYAVFSKGSIGLSLELLKDASFIDFRKQATNDIEKLDKMNLLEMYEYIKRLEDDKKNIGKVIDMFLFAYRDALVFKEIGDGEVMIQKDTAYISKDIAKSSTKNIIEKIQKLLDTKVYLEQNANFNMAMECLFLKLKEK